MPFPTFSDFINHLDREGELTRVGASVSPILEISEICDRVCKTPASHGHRERDKSPAAALGGKALLFENVQGSDIPVAINTFGSYWRMNQALGSTTLDELADRVQQLVKPEIPTTLLDKMKRLPDLMKMASFPPKTVRTGICQQVVLEGDQADLTRLPLIQCWPLDGNLDSGQVADCSAVAGAPRGTGR
jgi:4-hydroxy-3-polyprenylbenzoate decarboxylase